MIFYVGLWNLNTFQKQMKSDIWQTMVYGSFQVFELWYCHL